MRIVNGWTILGEITDKRTWYRVKCLCGYEGRRRKDHVESGRSKYCKKCSAKNTIAEHPHSRFGPREHSGVGDLGRTFWCHIQAGARRRGIEFDISIEYAWELFQSQGCRCSLSGELISLSTEVRGNNPDYGKFTASLDRKDSSVGYVEGNVHWVHKDINRMKGNHSDNEFTDWCRKVSQNFTDRIEL